MVSTHPLISKPTSPCTNPLVTVPRALFTIDVTITFMFHSFFSSLARFSYLFFFLLSFIFTLWSSWTAKPTNWPVLFFRLLLLGLVVWLRLGDPFVSQNPIGVCVSHSLGEILGCAYTI